MTPDELKKELIDQLIPVKYKKVVTNGFPESWLVLTKGLYVFAFLPFSEIPSDDFGNSHVKKILRKALHAYPILFNRGLFILYFGSSESWSKVYNKFNVDKTGFHSVIVQAVHFFDIDTGQNINTRTSWGPIKFGFCRPTIEKIESIGNKIKQNLTKASSRL